MILIGIFFTFFSQRKIIDLMMLSILFFSNMQLVVFVAHLLEMFFKVKKASFSINQEDLLLCTSSFSETCLQK